jgi:putative addiction module component (TIGR02574 family)
MSDIVSDLAGLSPQDRLQLIEWLWDSLDDHEVPLSDAQRKELSRRLSSFEQDREHGVTWETLKAELQERH